MGLGNIFSSAGSTTVSENIVASALFVLESFADVHQGEQQNDENEWGNKLWLPVTTVFNLMKFYHNNAKILLRVIQGFNRIYFMASERVKAKMVQGYSELKISDFVYEKVVKTQIGHMTYDVEIKRELQEMQTNILNGFYGPLLKIGPMDQQTLIKRLQMMRKDVFDIKENESGDYSDEHYELLGCSDPREPSEEFKNSPSGKLALYLLFYFKTKYKKEFQKSINGYACKAKHVIGCPPLIASSIQMVALICDVLQIKIEIIPVEYRTLKYRQRQSTMEEGEFVPMFFENQEFEEEIF